MPTNSDVSKKNKGKFYQKYVTIYLNCEEILITFQIP